MPLLLGNVPPTLRDAQKLAGLGVRAVITGHRPHSAAVRATYETLRDTRAGVLGPQPDDEPSMINRLSRKTQFCAWHTAFLTSDKEAQS